MDDGTEIQGNWQGRGTWYDARVTDSRVQNHACFYDVRYGDGDTGRNLPSSRVREVVIVNYDVCDRVEANYNGAGQWYAARVSRRAGNGRAARYSVRYDDGD